MVVFLAAAAIAAVGDWVAVARRDQRLEYVFKPLTTLLLLGAALAVDPDVPARRWWFVVALALSLVGDVSLMLGRFVPGLAAFLVAHLAYIPGLRIGGEAWVWVVVAAVP